MITKKSIIIILSILFFDSSLFYSQLSGATSGKQNGGYIFELSYGGSNQFSDIPNTDGSWGAALSLGKMIYYDEEATFTYDILGNISFLKNKGLDIDPLFKDFKNPVLQKTDYDIFYFNYRTITLALGVEAKITFNKYRASQHWYTSLALAGNLGAYSVKMNLKDKNGNYYTGKFDEIKSLPKDKRESKLKSILDDSYETRAEGFEKFPFKPAFMPSITLEAGYDITNYLTFYIADKLYFTNSNYIDGDIHTDDANDLLNYYHAGIKYYFHKTTPAYFNPAPAYDDAVPGYEIPQVVNQHNFPEVKIIQPSERPYVSHSKEVHIKAKINNVLSAENVKCKVNGAKVPFDFNKKFVTFTAPLVTGKNTITIIVKNDYGMAKDVLTVYFNKKNDDISEPEIQLISPPEPVYKSDDEIFTIKALINYVKDKDDIKISANGHAFKSYRYNPDTKEFKIKVRLAEGLNRFEIVAKNEEGKAISNFDIYYKTDIPDSDTNPQNDNPNDSGNNDSGGTNATLAPSINIINPPASAYTLHNTDLLDFSAKLNGVKSKKDITFTVNGKKNKFFDFDPSTGILKDKISLFDDKSVIKITATNPYGKAEKEITVMLDYGDGAEEELQKIIEFVNVSTPDEDCLTHIIAKIPDATGKNQLRLLLNDMEIRNFSFNRDTKLLKSSLYLDEGKNTIKVIFKDDKGEEFSSVYNISCGNGDDNNSQGNNGDDDGGQTLSPVIEVLQPANSSLIEDEKILLKALVGYVPDKDNINIVFNDENIENFSFDPDEQTLFATLKPIEGENKIIISATNDFGSSIKEVTFTYEPPLAGPPEVLINAPRNKIQTEKETLVFRARVENVKDPEDIYVTFNGKDYRDFNFDKENSIIYSVLPLKLGKNTIRVEAENRLGSDSDEVTFERRIKVLPAVKIIEPKNNNIIVYGRAAIKAIVQNVKKKSDAVILVNGRPYQSLNLKDEILTSLIYLKEGENKIVVKVRNDYGSAADTITLFFKTKMEKPTITLVNPAKSGVTVHNKNLELKVKVTGIKHTDNVVLTVNGININDLSYYRRDKIIKADVKLKKGSNIIRIIAKNDSGRAVKEFQVFLE